MIIRIKNLRLRAIIGIHPWEKVDKQALVVNVEIEFDGTAAARTEDIKETIDYSTLSTKITEHVENSRYELIETLATRLLELVMEDPRVERARVEVDKPKAIPSADSTSVEVSGVRA